MRSWSIKLFRLFGIRLELHATFLLLVVAMGYWGYHSAGIPGLQGALVYTFLIFTSVLLHEYGHCFAAKRYGVKIPRILLLPIGGMAQFSHIPREPGRELIITAAGPAVNFLIAGIIYAFIGLPPMWMYAAPFTLDPEKVLVLLMIWNTAMGVFNLLPIFPMDGGRILRALLAIRYDYLTATRISVYTGKVLAGIGIFIALFYLQNPLTVALFAFIFIGGEMELRQLTRIEAYAGLSIRDVTQSAELEEVFPLQTQTPVLQANWPLEFYAPLFESQEDMTYPVYADNAFIGVVKTRNFTETLRFAQSRRKALNRAPTAPPP
ncbi:MAG: site-2 protease family protein [Verrucomicrobiota bacterium]